MHFEIYKPIVMFFGLTNLPTTFQVMINDILRDLINTGHMVTFINVLVGTENKRRYDKIVKKVLRRIKENDFQIKPEKYIQKVKEIDFLGLAIGVEGIKIQKEKVVNILEWLKPKIVKNVQKFLELANYYR